VKAVSDAVTNVASTHLKLHDCIAEVRAECLPLHKTNQYRSSNNVALRNSPFHSDNTAQSQLDQHHWETYQRHWDEVPVQKLAKRAVCTLHHCQCTHKRKINSRTATIMVLALLSPPILHALANNAFRVHSHPKLMKNMFAMECSHPIAANAAIGHHSATTFPNMSCAANPKYRAQHTIQLQPTPFKNNTPKPW
jgi:hypothetical protein